MPNKLRAFISSTMEDLGNERRAVVAQLRSMNVEPVHAEEISPSGGTSWETIRAEIDDCHLFVLILGDRYGWEPEDGYGGGSGLSVTHLELQAARAAGKLVLAFVKKPSSRAAPDAKREDLRKEISAWKDGVFRQEFEWADELAAKVGAAVTNLWTDALLKQLVRKADRAGNSPEPRRAMHLATSAPDSKGTKLLLAGAGMSVSAGYPTAMVLMRILVEDLWSGGVDPAQLSPYSFSELAAFYELRLGRKALERRISEALDTPQKVNPTLAHRLAVRAFKTIVTTNYDSLFEVACALEGVALRVLHPMDEVPAEPFHGLTLYKIVGSVNAPHTLVLTTGDLQNASRGAAFEAALELFKRHDLVVIGHSLRDGNVQQLLSHRGPGNQAIYVTPLVNPVDEIITSRFGLERVTATADTFMESFGTTR